MTTNISVLKSYYDTVKRQLKLDIVSDATGNAIHDLALLCLRFLESECVSIPLTSLVPGKSYVSYARRGRKTALSRPANVALFNPDSKAVSEHWEAWWHGHIDKDDLARMSYTIALAPCLALELFDRQNKKGPATYFECLIGHIFAKSIGTNPHKKVSLPILGRQIRMTMDFLFDMGVGNKHVHLPVKMSTRERVVQAWAHQRLLDAAYGDRKYRGIMVCFAETKLSVKRREVVEICVPDQWLAYQSLLAKMDRIYYFDVPARYAKLALDFPDLLKIK
jgi:hypothetical protein